MEVCICCRAPLDANGDCTFCDVERVKPGSIYDWELSDDTKRRIEEIDRHIIRKPSIR